MFSCPVKSCISPLLSGVDNLVVKALFKPAWALIDISSKIFSSGLFPLSVSLLPKSSGAGGKSFCEDTLLIASTKARINSALDLAHGSGVLFCHGSIKGLAYLARIPFFISFKACSIEFNAVIALSVFLVKDCSRNTVGLSFSVFGVVTFSCFGGIENGFVLG